MAKKKYWKAKSKRKEKNRRPPTRSLVREKFDIDYFLMAEHRTEIENWQYEIVLAKYRKDDAAVKQLQMKILKSRSGRVLAVKRVVANKGIRSKGLSKPPFEALETVEQYEAMIDELEKIIDNPQLYIADPLDRIKIPKPQGGTRPLSIPSYRDRCLQALVKLALDPIAECFADRHSYGFRKGRSPSWAAKTVLLFLKGPKYKYQYGLELDIKQCFDKINHEWIIQNIPFPGDIRILKEWLKCGLIERIDESQTWQESLEGVPQGGVISPIIANMVLDKLTPYISTAIERTVTDGTFKKTDTSHQLVRFADDAVVLCRTYDVAVFVKQVISQFLAPRGLELNETKTHITNLHSDVYFKFVGFEFVRKLRAEGRSTKIIPPRDSVKKLMSKIKAITEEGKNIRDIVQDLNSLVRGWGYYYSIANSKQIFRKIDHLYTKRVYRKAYTLLRQRFPKYSYEEIGSKFESDHIEKVSNEYRTRSYFIVRGNDKLKDLYLFSLVELDIMYGSIRAGLNAYLASDKKQLHTSQNSFRSGQRKRILEKNDYRCRLCGAEIDLDEESWEIHHKRPSAVGGLNRIPNLIPLCTTPCHKDVSKAVSTKDYKSAMNFIACDVLDLPEEVLAAYSTNRSSL